MSKLNLDIKTKLLKNKINYRRTEEEHEDNRRVRDIGCSTS